jgi:hypothetical protein
MFKSNMFGTKEENDKFFNQYFPESNRRWQVTIFRNEVLEGGIKNIVVREYRNVGSKWLSGDIVGHNGMLQFINADGREVVLNSVPFIATEISPATTDRAVEAPPETCREN